MNLFKRETHINFLGKRNLAYAFSALLIVIAVLGIAVRGINLGLDFTGGTVIEVGYPKPVELEGIRGALDRIGYPEAVVQHFGTAKDVLIRLRPTDEKSDEIRDEIVSALSTQNAGANVRRVEFVGPQAGEQLKEKGGLALLWALGFILLYVAFRFEYRFAFASVAALIHDVIITVGVFAVFQIEFDLTVLAAILAVIGYSLNDTIVVFDRIRENFIRVRKGTPVEVADLSINQTLARTTMTSGTTLIVVIALYLLGGQLISGFALALLVGIIIGTYSSIYVASALALTFGVSKEDLIPPKKEGDEADSQP
ncbi:MAG TPA: protein translocase subunit SecF [Gammaproteobacteria bacterium]|nr:protein translocase subunit SecF [Gammaproteobacteria bacterium]